MTLARGGFEQFGKTTKRAAFLAAMDQVLPLGRVVRLLEPYYPKGGGRGRPPAGLERICASTSCSTGST